MAPASTAVPRGSPGCQTEAHGVTSAGVRPPVDQQPALARAQGFAAVAAPGGDPDQPVAAGQRVQFGQGVDPDLLDVRQPVRTDAQGGGLGLAARRGRTRAPPCAPGRRRDRSCAPRPPAGGRCCAAAAGAVRPPVPCAARSPSKRVQAPVAAAAQDPRDLGGGALVLEVAAEVAEGGEQRQHRRHAAVAPGAGSACRRAPGPADGSARAGRRQQVGRKVQADRAPRPAATPARCRPSPQPRSRTGACSRPAPPQQGQAAPRLGLVPVGVEQPVVGAERRGEPGLSHEASSGGCHGRLAVERHAPHQDRVDGLGAGAAGGPGSSAARGSRGGRGRRSRSARPAGRCCAAPPVRR